MKKSLKRTKKTNNHKHTKIIIILHVVPQMSVDKLFANFGSLLFLYYVFSPKKSKFSKNEKKKKYVQILSFYIIPGV